MGGTPFCVGAYVFLSIIFQVYSVTQQADVTSDRDHDPTGLDRQRRLVYKDPSKLWNTGVVPYTLSTKLSKSEIRDIHATMDLYEYFTPIRFILTSSSSYSQSTLGHAGYANFNDKDVGTGRCQSVIGFTKNLKKHDIHCCKKEDCIHEVGHLLGFKHEQGHPDRNEWIRVNWNSLLRTEYLSFQRLLSMEPFIQSTYDFSSFMHYEQENSSLGLDYSKFFPELSQRHDHFYMFKELCEAYKCKDFPQCQSQKQTCVNDGYVSVVNGKCACLCPPGLDPSTGCASLLKQVPSSVKMPEGRYDVLQLGNDCPDGLVKKSLVTPNGNWKICEHPKSHCSDSFCGWPRGSYCILKAGKCPTVRGVYIAKHSLPILGKEMRFCCVETGLTSDPVSLPANKPFSLFMGQDRKCQNILGMRAEERKIPHNFTKLIEGPFTDTQNVYVCDYKPVNMNCGDIVELNPTNPTTTIQSKCNNAFCDCTWNIQGSSKDGTLVLKFEEFDVKSASKKCIDSVEVRNSRIGQPGMIFCGKEVKNSIQSIYNKLMVRFQASKDSNFKATVTWKPASKWCYNSKDKGQSYNGKVSYTRRGLPCVSWKLATHCRYNPYNGGDVVTSLDENYCRNPDKTFRPWCYTDLNKCQRDFCDVCNLEKSFDDMTCEEIKDQGLCSEDMKGRCVATCSQPSDKASIPQCPTLNCANDGHVALVNGRCKCVCPPGLDPLNRCAKVIKKVDSSSRMPRGKYGLLRLGNDCPVGLVKKSLVTPNGNWNICQKSLQQFCRDSWCGWPPGKYCALKNGRCPTGGKGVYVGKLLVAPPVKLLKFCCFDTGLTSDPVSFPTSKPFTLFMGREKNCQEITGMRAEERKIPLKFTKSVDGPFTDPQNVYVCDYTPLDLNCGAIVDLDAAHPTTTINSNCGDASCDCTWIVQNLNKNGTLLLEFDDLSLKSTNKKCVDTMEVRNSGIGQPGVKFCSKKMSHSIRSEHDKLLIRFQASKASSSHFKATVNWKPGNLCSPPDSVSSGVLQNSTKNSYSIGDKLVYKCKHNSNLIERICLSSGQWSPGGTACTECPLGFGGYKGKCYRLVTEYLDYNSAVVECSKLGATLAMPKSEDENYHINSLRGKEYDYIWLGGSYNQTDKKWLWEDKTPVTWSNWRKSEPFLWKQHIKMAWPNFWIDSFFSDAYPFVCQTDQLDKPDCEDFLDNCPKLVGSNSDISCHSSKSLNNVSPNLWNLCRYTCGRCSKEKCYDSSMTGLYGGNVYRTKSSKPCVPWKDAINCPYNPYRIGDFLDNLDSNYCRSPDGSATPWCYTDLNGCQREFCDVCQTVSSMTCDMSSLGGQKDIIYKVGHKESAECSKAFNEKEYVCLISGQWAVSSTSCTKCPIGFAFFKDSCYTYNDEPKSHQEAVDICKAKGSLLARSKTEEENKFLHSFRKPGQTIWLGGSYSGSSWAWNDGAAFKWTKWATGTESTRVASKLPSIFQKNCLFMNKDQTWNKMGCLSPYSFVCQRSILNEFFDDTDTLNTCSTLLPNATMCNLHPYLGNLCAATCKT